eukprot:728332-Prorocentrum_lima.AAC.1
MEVTPIPPPHGTVRCRAPPRACSRHHGGGADHSPPACNEASAICNAAPSALVGVWELLPDSRH